MKRNGDVVAAILLGNGIIIKPGQFAIIVNLTTIILTLKTNVWHFMSNFHPFSEIMRRITDEKILLFCILYFFLKPFVVVCSFFKLFENDFVFLCLKKQNMRICERDISNKNKQTHTHKTLKDGCCFTWKRRCYSCSCFEM